MQCVTCVVLRCVSFSAAMSLGATLIAAIAIAVLAINIAVHQVDQGHVGVYFRV